MSLGKLLGIFKKGANKAGKARKKGEKKAVVWPSGTRVGLVGHTNSGKTTYFTVLNECCKTDRHLQVSVSDHSTAAEFLANYRAIWGLSTAVESGTAVDLRGEQKFPDPTEDEKVIQFNATLDRGRKLNVVSYDYPGRAIDINERSEQKDRVEEFVTNADGLLFFYDPKLLQAELQNQARVSSFVNVIEQIAPLGAKLPVPVALVVTKADILPGFSGEDQVMLVPTADESILAEDFDVFLQRVLESNRLQDNPKWAATVRELLLKLRDFLRVVVGRTLNFQIFFSSSTGTAPEKIGSDVGRSIYRPPRKMVPVGVKEPMYWLLTAIVGNRRISRFRSVARWAAMLSVFWVVIFSVPFAWHFWYALPETQRIESDTLKPYRGNLAAADPQQLGRISEAYGSYARSFVVKSLFRSYGPPAERLRNLYRAYDVADARKQLDEIIVQFAAIVRDTTSWPTPNPSDTVLRLTPMHEKLLAELEVFHQGDSTSELYQRAGRVLNYWELFGRALRTPSDTVGWNVVRAQVQEDQKFFASQVSTGEQDLGAALTEHEVRETKRVIAKQAAGSLDRSFVKEINGNSSPEYRLEDAVERLEEIKAKLDPADTKNRQMIDSYIADAKAWQRGREYSITLENIGGASHLHIAVTNAGQDAKFDLDQTYPGNAVKVNWKPGQEIHVVIDTSAATCQFGKDPADKVVLRGKYALFDLERGVSFPNVKQTASFRIDPPPADRLPELK